MRVFGDSYFVSMAYTRMIILHTCPKSTIGIFFIGNTIILKAIIFQLYTIPGRDIYIFSKCSLI